MIGGAAHLINFQGSDTIAGIWMANKYYHCNMAGFSIPAAEHSTMSMWGRENEVGAYRNMIAQYGDTNIFACVSDTWDIYNAAENLWGGELKEEVMKMKATLVVRPDSGDPVTVVNELLRILDTKFGSTVNEKGFKILNKVRVIQGDGINADVMEKILDGATALGYSTTNIAFGMGGGLLQKDFDRDTQKFAFKCCWAKVDGKEIEVYKDPITDPGKMSKKGLLNLAVHDRTVKTVTGASSHGSLMATVYDSGKIVKEYTFADIRANAEVGPYTQE
jgi:nicotinamide phosphoribosyltransferase